MIEVQINNISVVQNQLDRLGKGLDDNRYLLMRQLSETMHTAVKMNFRQSGRPKWLGLKYRDGKPLIDTGHLRNSFSTLSDNDSAIVGTNVVYAAIHNFGGRTKPHTIYPRHKKALAFGGKVLKKVNHPGSNIPARPFMVLTETDKQNMMDEVQGYFQRLVK